MQRRGNRGKFIVIDGIDGAGKSLQTRLLQARLETRYAIACVSTREPGGSPLGERIRSLLLQEDGRGVDAITEALLFNAARRDHLHRVIEPALDKGFWVICDRFSFSSFAYQGAGGANLSLLETLHGIAVSNIAEDYASTREPRRKPDLENSDLENTDLENSNLGAPDLGIVLDLTPERSMQRSASKRGQTSTKADNFESRDRQFFGKVRAIFLQMAQREGTLWSVIDASEAIELVADRIEQRVASHFSLKLSAKESAKELATSERS